MTKLLPLLFLLSPPIAFAEGTVRFEQIVHYSEGVAGHSIKVVMHQRLYDFSKHDVKGGDAGARGPATIDGTTILGTDGSSPKMLDGWPMLKTLVSIELEWDGQRIPVPKELHLNLLSLTLREDSIQFIPRPSGEELLIQATGGDGGGSYLVQLVLRKDGNHQQFEGCEEVLPPYPHEICEQIGTDEEGRVIVRYFNWLGPGSAADAVLRSPDARYEVTLVQPTGDEKSTLIVLRDLKTNQQIWDFDYDSVAERHVSDLRGGWSPDSRHLALTIQVARVVETMVLRVEEEKVEEVEMLPIPEKLDNPSYTHRGGEFFSHWESNEALWINNNTKNRSFRFFMTQDGKMLADAFEDDPAP